MKITSYVSFLYCLCLMLASPTVQASEVRTAIFEGKPCINPPDDALSAGPRIFP